MIMGIFLRNIKTYRGYNYIPIFSDDKFCGLVGNNGVGKSSILEALDSVINGKPLNLNVVTKRSGMVETYPHAVPVFLMNKSEFSGVPGNLANLLSEVARTIEETDVGSSSVLKEVTRKFSSHRDFVGTRINLDEYFLLPIGLDYQGNISLSVFNCKRLVDLVGGSDEEVKLFDSEQLKLFKPLHDELRLLIDYIYIPKEIDSESFTKLETKEIQSLMGASLNQIIEGLVSAEDVREINDKLKNFLDGLSDKLGEYTYRTRTDRQQNLKKQDVYNLIIQAFFNIRALHKKLGESWLEIGSLSSGEKQKAIIEVAHSLIKNQRGGGDSLILAIDEPESSLHMSACFEQFSKLYEISRACRQLFFATHWYGFFPVIESGSATVIAREDDTHNFDLISLGNHREHVKQLTSESKGALPYDVRLKSINDLVQSIVGSSIGKDPYRWLICEGSSEKLYLSEYLKDLIENSKLRIIPVGGAKEIKRLYQHLALAHEEFRGEITGRIYLLADTDAQLVAYEARDFDRLICRRMVANAATKSIDLVKINSNPFSPATEIEHALNGALFFNTLNSFAADNPLLSFLSSHPQAGQDASAFALDLRDSEKSAIQAFFDQGNNKFEFAKDYISGLSSEYTTPSWILEIRKWLSQDIKTTS